MKAACASPAWRVWPGKIPAGSKLTGIQGHQDLFTVLAEAAGVPDVAERVMEEKRQYIDGVNNLAYWLGEEEESRRTYIFHYYESKLTACAWGRWKFHFSTKEDYYANVVPRTVPLVFNLRMDPYESYDNKDSHGRLLQKMSWLLQPMGVADGRAPPDPADYPPAQGGKSFERRQVVRYVQRGGAVHATRLGLRRVRVLFQLGAAVLLRRDSSRRQR